MINFWLGSLIGVALGVALAWFGYEPVEAFWRGQPKDATVAGITLGFAFILVVCLMAGDLLKGLPDLPSADAVKRLAVQVAIAGIAAGIFLACVLNFHSRPDALRFALLSLSVGGAGIVSVELWQVSKKEPPTLRSSWGGLGDGLGGWELNRSGALLLLALAFVSAALWAGVTFGQEHVRAHHQAPGSQHDSHGAGSQDDKEPDASPPAEKKP